MPQLDKFTFYHQIFWLTVFFFLIYFLIRRYAIPRIHRIILYRLYKIVNFKKRRKNWAIRVKNNEVFTTSFFYDLFDVVKTFNLKFYNFYKTIIDIEISKNSKNLFNSVYQKQVNNYFIKLKNLNLSYNV